MKILVLGAAGQVGRELVKSLAPLGEVVPVTRQDCDLGDLPSVASLLDRESPAILVNAAAYTAVDAAETDVAQATLINGQLPQLLANWCRDNNALLVDFSTDYIFDGSKQGAWEESDKRSPLNAYGRSKLAGLEAIENSGCRYLVFIVTWIYASQGKNFPATMLRLAAQKTELKVVADQFGAPTPADWIAEQVAHCIPQVLQDLSKAGLYNLAPADCTSWCDFAREIIGQAAIKGAVLTLTPAAINPVLTTQYPTPARRPANSVLNTQKLRTAFAILPPDWRTLYRQRT
jgi:dTDP-4-dehydrorhamnose reductase